MFLSLSSALAFAAKVEGRESGRWLTDAPGRPLVEPGRRMRAPSSPVPDDTDRRDGSSGVASTKPGADRASTAVSPSRQPRRTRWQPVARHAYSKVQAWNCDASLLWLSNRGASPEIVFLDAASGRVRFQRDAPGSEIRWLPDDPDTMLFVDDDTLGLWNPIQDEVEIVERFPALGELGIGPWEGNLSISGGELVLTGTHRRNGARVSLLYDRIERRVIARHRHPRDETLDWISVSASGRYIVSNGSLDGGGFDQTRVFDRRFRPVGDPWLEYGLPSHFDLTRDARGEDVAVGVAKSGEHEGRVISRRLRDGAIRRLTEGGYASHTSARNTQLPGWVFVTYPNAPSAWPGRAREIVAVSLAGAPPRRVARLGPYDERYDAQPQALPSPDGSEVLWAAIRSSAAIDDASRSSMASRSRRGGADGDRLVVGTRIAGTGLRAHAAEAAREVNRGPNRTPCRSPR